MCWIWQKKVNIIDLIDNSLNVLEYLMKDSNFCVCVFSHRTNTLCINNKWNFTLWIIRVYCSIITMLYA